MGELRAPVEAWGLCGAFHVHVLLLASQLNQLRPEQGARASSVRLHAAAAAALRWVRSTSAGVHSHAGRPVRRALVVGHVVDVTSTRKFLRFAGACAQRPRPRGLLFEAVCAS
jgi:hypothetical protein